MKKTQLLFYAITFLSITNNLFAEEYFVSLNGSDSNEGSISAPFLSLEKASEKAIEGDTITIREGCYLLDRYFTPKKSGTSKKWIIYRSMPEEDVVLDGRNVLYDESLGGKKPFSEQTKGLFNIENISFVKVENIGIANSRAAGIIVKGPRCENIELNGCTIDRSYNSGIGIWYAEKVKVIGCNVTRANDITFRNVEVPEPNEAPHEAISICGARDFEIANNHVHHCYKEGIDCKEISKRGKIHHNHVNNLPRQAYYVDAWFGLLEDVELYSNTANDCAWGFAISVEGKDSELKNIRFHHNLIYNMKASGILFGVWGNDKLRSDIHIYNNTIYKCGSPNWFSGGVGSINILSKNFKDIFIYRNICDKGWDYEMGFSFNPSNIKQELKKRNFHAIDNLMECAKNRPSRNGQFNLYVSEYLPEGNNIGSVLYRNEIEHDFVPEMMPKVKSIKLKLKYEPSPWYGAFKPTI